MPSVAASAPAEGGKTATATINAGPPSQLKVQGNKLVDGSGSTVQLRGVARPGMEWPCAQGWGLVDGPLDDAAVTAITSWKVNVVRLHLNEHCWLGLDTIKAEYGGAVYQEMVKGFVDKLQNAGLYVIIDMHWSAPGNKDATTQQKMADADHAPDFWTSVATTFKSYPGVIFDLFNEPQGISDACWRDGCTVEQDVHPPNGWKAVGYQQLIEVVRATGATQPVLVQCNGWGNHCAGVEDPPSAKKGKKNKAKAAEGGWLANRPTDPLNNIIAGVHLYDYTECNVPGCWDAEIAPLAAEVPVITGEFGDTDCNHDFTDQYTAWAEEKGISYVGYAWYPGSCAGTPSMIKNWDGTPSPYGVGLHDRLASLSSDNG
ncbi:cellulase family glycosylhydrolase [Streptomyces aculeolatus]